MKKSELDYWNKISDLKKVIKNFVDIPNEQLIYLCLKVDEYKDDGNYNALYGWSDDRFTVSRMRTLITGFYECHLANKCVNKINDQILLIIRDRFMSDLSKIVRHDFENFN